MLREVLDIFELLEGSPTGEDVAAYLRENGAGDVQVRRCEEDSFHTDFIHLVIKGRRGRSVGGDVATLGLVGRLGGIGARPARIGLVSDADGAISVLAAALRLLRMQTRGDVLEGDVSISTHICPNAPTMLHEPVPFMGSPVSMRTMNMAEVTEDMEAVLSVDATKGNMVLNHRGVAITPVVREGCLLPVSQSLLELLGYVTGRAPEVLALSQYDVTPYGNGLHHINSILQPACVTDAPVVGVAITSASVVPGCATGASQETDIREASAFCVETAKMMQNGLGIFCDEAMFQRAKQLYGTMKHFLAGGE